MILLIDADSLVYSCSYSVESEAEAMYKFDKHINFIVDDISDHYQVDKIKVYHGSRNNFRTKINDTYKANRKGKEKPAFYTELSNYVQEGYDAISAIGEEVDDVVARDWRYHKNKGDDPCIVSIDKDYLQLPALIYNYSENRRGFTEPTEEEARHNFWVQMITGDAADNVNYLKGKGIKYAQKHLEGCLSDFQYIRRVYTLFVEKYAEDARKCFTECYTLLKIG